MDTSPCLYCGGVDYSPLYPQVRDRLGYVPGERAFVRCRACGSALLRPMPRAEELPAFYPPVYTFTPELARGGTVKRLLAALEYRVFYRNAYARQVRMVRRNTAPHAAPGRLLDIGCGRGLRLLEFRRAGYDVRGMDFTPESVKYVNEQLNVPAVCTDAEGLASAFPPGSFDVITAFYVLEHVVDFRMTIGHCLRLLKPGGWLAAAVPLIDSTHAAVFGAHSASVTEAPRHVSIPTQRAVRIAFAECGYRAASFRLRPDAVLACAGVAGLSIFPGSNSSAVYGTAKLKGTAIRLCGALAAAVAVPWTFVDNYVLRRPALGIVFAQKPM